MNHITKTAQFNHPSALGAQRQEALQYQQNGANSQQQDVSAIVAAHRRVPSLLSPNQNNEGLCLQANVT